MNTDRPIAIIEKYNNSNINKNVEAINRLDNTTAVSSFVLWIQKLKVDTFRIYCTSIKFEIKFNIYCISSVNSLRYIIVNTIVINETTSSKNYEIEGKFKQIDIDNIGDIISFFTKICNDNIINLKEDSIVELINFQMKRVASEIK